MESIEARAFKSSSLVSEASMKPVNAGVGEDYLFVSSAGAGDDFSIDEFFDLEGLSEEEEKSSSSSLSLSSQDQIDEQTSFSGDFSGAGLSNDGLAIPADDMKELELWSHLMDDTLHDDIFAGPTHYPYVITGPNRVRFEPKTIPAMVEATRFPPPALTRPRSKRSRPINGAWSSSSLLNLDYSSSSVSSTPKPGRVRHSLDGSVQERKCTHCQVQKTPQWRTGPLGPKTLCNACGVRFKSGRLFPEYRPACSPTFSREIHSNSHRKVVEMRKRKMSEPAGPGFAPTILSCWRVGKSCEPV